MRQSDFQYDSLDAIQQKPLAEEFQSKLPSNLFHTAEESSSVITNQILMEILQRNNFHSYPLITIGESMQQSTFSHSSRSTSVLSSSDISIETAENWALIASPTVNGDSLLGMGCF